jgi:hypothetical protein
MAWSCYSCQTKIPNSVDQCPKCGGTVAAPRSFYLQWVFGGAIFFFITYLAGTLAGGTLVAFAATPDDAVVLEQVNASLEQGASTYKSIETVEPDKLAAAKAVVVLRAQEQMSKVVYGLLFWVLPALLFVICGIIVGFVSDGKTIIEAGLGSIIGQLGGIFLFSYITDSSLSWLVLAIGIAPGFGLAVLGAWLGEIIQDRKEAAGGITG